MVTLVTGATGFIGNALATALRDRGDNVRGLVRDPSRARGLAPGIDLVSGDVTDPVSLRAAVAGADRVFHTAGLVGDWLDRGEALRVNVEGTRNLISAADAAGVRRFVHMSSLSVLGTKHHYGTDESGPYEYGDVYTDTKIDSERVVREFQSLGDLESVCLRPGFVYGPGDRQVVPGLLNALATGQFVYVGDGGKQMNTIYIDDLVDIALRAGESAAAAGGVYNLNDGERTPLRDFVGYMTTYLGMPAPTRHVPPPVAIAGCYAIETMARLVRSRKPPRLNRSRLRFIYYNQSYSIDKARSELEFAPQFGYRKALPPTLEWFRRADLLPAVAASGAGA
jgi:nucleoside-diphosphate-sugar epimerase